MIPGKRHCQLMRRLSSWLAGISPEIALHINRFFSAFSHGGPRGHAGRRCSLRMWRAGRCHSSAWEAVRANKQGCNKICIQPSDAMRKDRPNGLLTVSRVSDTEALYAGRALSSAAVLESSGATFTR